MTAANAKVNKSGYCTTFAAAYTSAHELVKMDTALQVVSILLARFDRILVRIS